MGSYRYHCLLSWCNRVLCLSYHHEHVHVTKHHLQLNSLVHSNGNMQCGHDRHQFRARFLSLARSKPRLCSANHRTGYWSNLPCDWLSTAWAYSEQVTENRPREWLVNWFTASHLLSLFSVTYNLALTRSNNVLIWLPMPMLTTQHQKSSQKHQSTTTNSYATIYDNECDNC